MNELVFFDGGDITVTINGEKLPLVESVSEECRAEYLPVCVFGEAGVREHIGKGRRHTLCITRLPGASLPELFTLTLTDGDRAVRYSGCRCAERRTDHCADGIRRETLTVLAAGREELS